MSYQFLLLYTMTIFVASIVPGPSMLLALTHGVRYGAKKTMVSALGNLSVSLLQALISGVGLGAILMASETTFQLIKWAGAAYLIYMGLMIWRSSAFSAMSAREESGCPTVGLSKLYWQAAFVTAGNPKAILFFTAIFPQFIDPHKAFVPQFAILMMIGAVVAFSCFMIYAVCGHKVMSLFSKTPMRKYFNRVVGGSFIAAGIGLAVSRK